MPVSNFPFGFFKAMALAVKSRRNISEKISLLLTLLVLKFKKNLFSNPGKSECTIKILGYKVSGYDYATMQDLFTEIFLTEPYFLNANSENPVIIDGGSNIGFSVLYYKNIFPHSAIHAFEANPHAFKFLEKNISQNNLSHVSMYNVALSDRKGETTLYIDNNPATIYGSVKKDVSRTTELKVKSMLLSEFISSIKDEIELIKLDVEGSELEIISDLFNSSVLSLPNQYIIEYHHKPSGGESVLANFFKKFETCGYEYTIKSLGLLNKTKDYQDFIIHFYK